MGKYDSYRSSLKNNMEIIDGETFNFEHNKHKKSAKKVRKALLDIKKVATKFREMLQEDLKAMPVRRRNMSEEQKAEIVRKRKETLERKKRKR